MNSITELSIHHQEMVNGELEAGERVEWAGMPVPRYFTRDSGSLFLFCFGIPWTAFALFWTVVVVWRMLNDFDGAGFIFLLFGVPCILIGIVMLSSPIRVYRNASKTVYIITDRRAITFDGGRSMTIRSYPPEKLQDIYRKEHKNGTGDVIFTRRPWQDAHGDRQWEEQGFLRVTEPKSIEKLLKHVAESRSFASRG